ncbi:MULTISPECIES: sensor histidine kinase [Bacillus]|uniref:histidine kinase n=1 Tax=Bacillus pseudomycoides TaxID=64104 RepID=A0AAJ1ZB09_9BACI|nr:MULTISPECIES: HAMP domain-containing sensor histidine kinase [Bacillus]KFN08955.1 his Kinase A domain protein [Bacillus pseudomycoides]MBD5797980.1 two-component sensor histidine kinase [Bacillus pseudomycoides]MCR8861224.1 HAMP domain-containing histidine kinase [Bacillus pseudomycoides]MDR4190866.1 HAMP domain-containing histidine kinase [Bacillus pseudomycoides]MDR4329721.1 HAMP domain-containing histidine kinase [Bacillus pseudomycoides]
MKNDKVLYLLLLQLLAITVLLFIDISNNQLETGRLALFIALFIMTISLFFIRLHFIENRKSMVTGLKRAIKGNTHARLYTNNDHSLDEVIFSTNELITALEKVQIEAVKSHESRKQLLSSISHDIRTPLTSIIGYVDALKDDIATSEEEKREYLEIISKKSGNLKQLVDEIFNMAKLDADEFPLKEEPLNFAEIARESLIEFLPELTKHDLELQVSIPETPCPVTADYLSLIRVIGNLMKNAIYYGKSGKIIGIKLLETTNEYQLLIWDKGPGISKHDLNNVFERMYRSEQSRNHSHGGSGLGLAIAKALVEKNGGKIWVESIPWERTTFGFSIPKQTIFKKQLRND